MGWLVFEVTELPSKEINKNVVKHDMRQFINYIYKTIKLFSEKPGYFSSSSRTLLGRSCSKTERVIQ